MSPSTRDMLIDAAESLLDRGGVDAVTLRDVGRMAGVSHNAPYKHFPNKEALLAAVAARDLIHRETAMSSAIASGATPADVLRGVLHDYIVDALAHPARFKLVFGRWTTQSDELDVAAKNAQTRLYEVVAAAQHAGALPPGDCDRLAALLRSTAHGAADLAAAGHLAAGGKGNAEPQDLVDDLLSYLQSPSSGARTRSRAKRGAAYS